LSSVNCVFPRQVENRDGRQLLGWWRFAVVGAALVAALITPTVDPFNMAMVMGPLILLYFLSILMARLAR
jgi:sec-independent protein translocase protein TatC